MALHRNERGRPSRIVALAGAPNVGKSVFFTALTGTFAEVSNYAGTTVDILRGRCGADTLIDTPGVYGLGSMNEEERAARDGILSADIILNVVDSVHLARDLFLTLQLIDMGKPMLVVLNMMDESTRAGIRIDRALLEELLGVPVIGASGRLGIGVREVRARIGESRIGRQDESVRAVLAPMISQAVPQAEALLIAEGDAETAAKHRVPSGDRREEISAHRRRRADDIVHRVVSGRRCSSSLSERVGRWAVSPLAGTCILAFVLTMLYLFIGVFAAQTVVGVTEDILLRGLYEEWVRALLSPYVPADTLIGALLLGEYGVLTMAVTYIFGLLLPLVCAFYLALSVLEDSGYLPRLAAMTDRLMSLIGLNGRAVIPLILGFGCVTMATVTTRLMGSERERTIVCALLGLTIPCSAQLGIIAALAAALSPLYTFVYIASVLLVFGLVGRVLHHVLDGEPSGLLLDLPPMRLPQAKNVCAKTAARTRAFLCEAAPVFALGTIGITLAERAGLLAASQALLAPVTEGMLGLPRETATVFVMGIVRRDFAAAGLSEIALTEVQLTVALTVITLFVPCIASVLMMMKERGRCEGVLIWLSSWAVAFAVGAVVARLL